MKHFFYKRFCIIFLIICLCFTHSGCTQLLLIPFQLLAFVIALPFQILKIVIALIPLALKYAPLALLFVSRDNVDEIQQLEDIVSDLNKTEQVCEFRLCSVTPDVLCVQLAFAKQDRSYMQLAQTLEQIMTEHPDARLLFARNVDNDDFRQTIALLWDYMVRNDIHIGADEHIVRYFEKQHV